MSFPALKIGDLTAKIPVVQGGMGVGISLSGLASAVANQGGIGVIAGAMIGMKEPDVAKDPLTANLRALRNEILKARELSNGIIGVNLMVALTTFSQMVRTAVENKVDIIFSGAGLPLDMPHHLLQVCEEKKEEFKTKLVPIVSSARAATVIAKKWASRFGYTPDAFVVEGPKAGGHLGFKAEELQDPGHSLEVLVPQVVDAAANNQARAMLERDVDNMRNYYGMYAPELLKTRYAREMWSLFEDGKLGPETELTGLFEESREAIDLDGVLHEIESAQEEAMARRARLQAEQEEGS